MIQIKKAFEELDMTPEQIAESEGLDLTSVKACLFQVSSKYRGAAEENIDYNFTALEALEAKQTVLHLMRYSEDEHIRSKNAQFVLNDKKGRLDIGKNFAGVPMNVNIFQQFLVQAKGAIEASKKRNPVPAPEKQELIDV